MSNWYDDLMFKLDEAKSYCISTAESQGVINPVRSALAVQEYTKAFNDLKSSIDNYIADKETKKTDALDLIQWAFTYLLTTSVSYTPPLYSLEEPYPEGFSDFSLLYNMDGAYTTLLSSDVSYFYEGWDGGNDSTPISLTVLPSLKAKIDSAESVETIKRQAFIKACKDIMAKNTPILMTEELIPSDMPPSRQSVMKDIYITRKIKDIVLRYDLDVYLPTYIRE